MLVLPGGGIFFWWQAGAITGLKKRFDLNDLHHPAGSVSFIGSSAGALASTLAVSGCDMEASFDAAHRIATDVKLDRRGTWGLCGIWGGMIRKWLHECLPPDAHLRAAHRLHIGVREVTTTYPFIRPSSIISAWSTREDLIDVNMASIHIPLFIDGKLTARCSMDDLFYIDGGIGGTAELVGMAFALDTELDGAANRDGTDVVKRMADQGNVLVLSSDNDPRMQTPNMYSSSWTDPIKNASATSVQEMMQLGEQYVDEMDATGQLQLLDAFRSVQIDSEIESLRGGCNRPTAAVGCAPIRPD